MNENGGSVIRFSNEFALRRVFIPGSRPVTGQTVYLVDLNEFRVYDGSEWRTLDFTVHTPGCQPRLPGF